MTLSRLLQTQHIAHSRTQRVRRLTQSVCDAERSLWSELDCARLDGIIFYRQQVVAGYLVDFYCHSAGLAVLLDDPLAARNQRQNNARDYALTACGIAVMHVTNADILLTLPDVLDAIRWACASRL